MTIKITSTAIADERPLELLYACHDRIRRFTTLTARLSAHVAANGADNQAREAAAQILRYFELSLPNHHADEEADVFPALRGLSDIALAGSIAALEAEHCVLDALWQEVAPWLRRVEQGEALSAPDALAKFVANYTVHVEREEREVFPAIDQLPLETVDAIAQRMRSRRGG
jgi:hemerythrin-like domain-containing protein